jgi:branched-subunit amino acid permease
MNDIYKTPDSNLAVSLETRTISPELTEFESMLKEQRTVLAPSLALIFTILSIFPLALAKGSAPLLILLFPAFVVGLLIKYTSRLIKLNHRVISSLISTSVIFFILSFGNILTAIGVSLFSFFICLSLSRRPLTADQEKVLYKLKIGKLNP